MITTNYTMLLGVKNKKYNNIAFSVLYSTNEHGMPDSMYLRDDVMNDVIPRGNLPIHAEFIIRDNIRQSIENNNGLIQLYLSDFIYFNGIEVSQSNGYIFDKVRNFDLNHVGRNGETLLSFMSRHGLTELNSINIIAPSYGERDVLVIGLDRNKLNPEINLYEVNPNNLYYLKMIKNLLMEIMDF